MKKSAAHRLAMRAERGAVLFIALIVLVAMTLAGVALIRSVDTATLAAGNIAFKQAAEQAAERAVAAAMALFDPFSNPPGFFSLVANTNNNDATRNYCAQLEPTDARGIPLVLANFDPASPASATKACDGLPLDPANEIVSATGETLRFVIDRLCAAAGPLNEQSCSVGHVLPAGGTVGGGPHLGETVPLYRVTVRVDGPRRTVHFTQVVFRP